MILPGAFCESIKPGTREMLPRIRHPIVISRTNNTHALTLRQSRYINVFQIIFYALRRIDFQSAQHWKMMLETAVVTVLLLGSVLARPEPPVGQYLPPDQQYGPPQRNALSTGVQPGQSELGTSAFGTNQYLPPNQQYGPPGGAAGGGYNDGYNDTPAKYEFEYMVNDADSGNDFGHKESRDGDVARGVYYVLLPDGRRQTVEYIADQNGYRPVVSYTQEGAGIGNGYRNDGGSGYPSGNNGYRY